MDIELTSGSLSAEDQATVSAGFEVHTQTADAPGFQKDRLNWLVRNDDNSLRAALTADVLWDWLYVDELWVDTELRGQGVGRRLMRAAETFATGQQLPGVWLWPQRWQAAEFYAALGYVEVTRVENFPNGPERKGFRNTLTSRH